jgi:hypothetical protein
VKRLVSTFGTLLIVAVAAGGGVLTAHADATTDCAGLATALSGATDGDVITLDDDHLCPGAFTIPTGVNITLQGQDQGDGFDGQGTNQSLRGTDNGATVIRHLTFTNASGGALWLSGDVAPTLDAAIFLSNSGGGADFSATSGDVTVSNSTFGGVGQGNTSFEGAGLMAFGPHVLVTNNTFLHNHVTATSGGFSGGAVAVGGFAADDHAVVFRSNTVVGNTSDGASGAGAHLQGRGTVTITDNSFRDNSIAASNTGNRANRGGGLSTRTYGSDQFSRVFQARNRFENNVIHTLTFVADDGNQPEDFGGAGEFAGGPALVSVDDTFVNNHVDAGAGGNTAVGGGLAYTAESETDRGFFSASNLVAAHNGVGAGGEGGGIYVGFGVGCRQEPCPSQMDLFDSTVTSNTVGADGEGREIAGDEDDIAHVTNSIVTGAAGSGTDIEGFGTLTVTRSDTCVAGAAATGSGNICANPLLAGVATNDVHQTASSPSRDKGDTAVVPAGLDNDYEGDTRVLEAAVDMGADEFSPEPPTLPAAGQPGESAATAEAVLALGVVCVALLGGFMARSWRRTQAR